MITNITPAEQELAAELEKTKSVALLFALAVVAFASDNDALKDADAVREAVLPFESKLDQIFNGMDLETEVIAFLKGMKS